VNDERDLLIESVTSAWRDRDASGRVVPPPAWWDLAPDDRLLAFDAQAETRELERARDDAGFSGTVRAVLERLTR
jgi:hypothetical protein